MNNKRKEFEDQDGKAAIYNKRSRLNNNLASSDDLPTSSQPRIDPTYGQRSAFPGLDDPHDDNALFHGPASDGLEYLRMVRSEAKTVPNLLVAPSSPNVPSEKPNLYADYPQGYYSDGAYTATPLPHSKHSQAHTNGGQQGDKDPQEAYYTSLCARFTELTEMLKSLPPRVVPDNTDIYYLEWRNFRPWREEMMNTAPRMVLLTQLTQEGVVCGLGALSSLLTLARLRGAKGKNIGAWGWGLLGRCREVGQMGSEDVGVVRNLGKQAVWLFRRISAGEIIGSAEDEPDVKEDEEEDAEGEEECVEDGTDSPDAVDADDGRSRSIDPITMAALRQDSNIEAHPPATIFEAEIAEAKQRILDTLDNHQAQADPTETNANNEDGVRHPASTYSVTELEVDGKRGLSESANEDATIHATLDMLVTIIGEFYGQRDLLDGRLLWDEMQ